MTDIHVDRRTDDDDNDSNDDKDYNNNSNENISYEQSWK